MGFRDSKVWAEKKMKAMLKKLGPGWQPYISENMGWHYCAIRPPVSMYEDEKGRFHCLMSDDPDKAHGGAGMWTLREAGYFKDPIKALAFQLKVVNEVTDRIDRARRAGNFTLQLMKEYRALESKARKSRNPDIMKVIEEYRALKRKARKHA